MSQPSQYLENGTHWGYCNACGEEADLYGECPDRCPDGEVVAYDDDIDPMDEYVGDDD